MYFARIKRAWDTFVQAQRIQDEDNNNQEDRNKTENASTSQQSDCTDRQASADMGENAGVAPTTPSRRARTNKFIRKWWVSWVIAFVVVLGVILTCLFTLIIPAMIRSAVNNNALPLQSGSIEALSANQIRMGLTTQVNGPPAFTVHLSAWDLHLSNVAAAEEKQDGNNADTAPSQQPPTFLTLRIPEQSFKGTADLVVEPQTQDVKNHAELAAFLARAFAGNPVDGAALRVRGSTTARVGIVKTVVTVDKTLRFAGLDNLIGTNVTNTEALPPSPPALSSSSSDDKSNIQGTLMIPNTSPFTLSLGTTICTLHGRMGPGLLDGYIGNTTVHDLVIRPGNQTVEYRGQLDIGSISTNMPEVVNHPEVKETGLVQIGFVGNKAIVDGEQIHYLDDVLHLLDIAADVPLAVGSTLVWRDMMSNMKTKFKGLDS